MFLLADNAESPDQTTLLIAILVAFPIFGFAMWAFVLFLLSNLGGWARLAKSYPAREPATGQYFPSKNGRVGWVNYKFVLNIHVSPQGLHIGISKLFGLFHPPLFIPWSAMNEPRLTHIFFLELISFTVGSPVIARVQLPKSIFVGTPIATPTA